MLHNGQVHWKTEYNLSDQTSTTLSSGLGNVRVVFAAHANGQPEVMQQTSYYPFGYTLQQNDYYASVTSENKNLYNGKELQDDVLAGSRLDWYDYGARFYDPVVGRFNSVDPLAGKYPSYSPYRYAANSPICNIDFNGKSPVIVIGGIILTATDMALIGLGVISSGAVLYVANDGTLAVNSKVLTLLDSWSSIFKLWNSDYEWQKKQAQKAKRLNQALQLSHQEWANRSSNNNPYNKNGGILAITLGIVELFSNTRDVLEQAKVRITTSIQEKKQELVGIIFNEEISLERKKTLREAILAEIESQEEEVNSIESALDVTSVH
ncbi:MAG: RHS repeat-associated core domain-containing protein [Bacteroidales bacterium]|nr:RHS repeat-associated core domain-containing protein [Bacteroidales bacterium]